VISCTSSEKRHLPRFRGVLSRALENKKERGSLVLGGDPIRRESKYMLRAGKRTSKEWLRRTTPRLVLDGMVAWGTQSRDFWNDGVAMSTGYGPLRAIPDVMTWRHHDSDAYDAFPDNDFSIHNVSTLTERIIDLRPVPPGLFLTLNLPPLGIFWLLSLVTMSEYLCFPFLSGTPIVQGAMTPLIIRLKIPKLLLPKKRRKPKRLELLLKRKKESKKRGNDEGGSFRVKKKKIPAAPKDVTANSAHVSSPTPLRMVAPVKQITLVDTGNTKEEPNALDDENRSTSNSPRGRNIKEGESSRGASIYVPRWVIPQRCHVDTPEWCQELMVHLAPPVAQEESSAITNEVALQRAWFSFPNYSATSSCLLSWWQSFV
ncbi:hypothetical protein Tco_1139378, partial [Tanacetum coccineum]